MDSDTSKLNMQERGEAASDHGRVANPQDYKSKTDKDKSKIKVGTGTFQGKENWRVTSDKHDDIGVFPKDKYSKEEAEAEYHKKINKPKDIKKAFQSLGIEI